MTMSDVELFQHALDDATARMWMAVGTLGGAANPPVDAPRMIVSGDTMADVMGQLEKAIRRHERVRVLVDLQNAQPDELMPAPERVT